MLNLVWEERAFIVKVNSRCWCYRWFLVAIFVYQNSIHEYGVSIYKVYNGAWNVSANNSEAVGHIDLRLVKLFIYQSFVTLHFLGFFHWTVFNLFFFCTVFIGWQWNGIDSRASATSSPGSSRFPIWKARRLWGRGWGLCSQGIGAKKKQREELGSGEVR